MTKFGKYLLLGTKNYQERKYLQIILFGYLETKSPTLGVLKKYSTTLVHIDKVQSAKA